MTEQEWLAYEWPLEPLEFLEGKASERKLRLLTATWCRQIWRFLNDELRQLVIASEQLADGQITQDAFDNALEAVDKLQSPEGNDSEMDAVWFAATSPDAPFDCCDNAADAIFVESLAKVGTAAVKEAQAVRAAHLKVQVSALRDIFGNPFCPVSVKPSWLTSDVVSLAKAIYDERAFDRMPIIGDALEEAGCDNADMLNHCRQPGVHVRGCWVVDLVLGKD
jgi:hypothetical protein